jgi:uncharacterized protein YydD (DUF2326 family)
MDFKNFLVIENKEYLGQKIGDILSALQDLEENLGSTGTRQAASQAEGIVSQIRRVLHSDWDRSNRQFLFALQKVAVALTKSIEEEGDVREIISSSARELEAVMQKMGVPVNKLASPPRADIENQG